GVFSKFRSVAVRRGSTNHLKTEEQHVEEACPCHHGFVVCSRIGIANGPRQALGVARQRPRRWNRGPRQYSSGHQGRPVSQHSAASERRSGGVPARGGAFWKR